MIQNSYFKQKISNRKDFTEVERECFINALIKDGKNEVISVAYEIRYTLDGNDVTNTFPRNEGVMIANNDTKVSYNSKTMQLDDEGVEIGYYDYLMILNDVARVFDKDILLQYIAKHDSEGKFETE